jgi:hypothetical protein
MTHDELLEKIKREEDYLKTYAEGYGFVVTDALRAVVELHKPDEPDFPDEWESCVECSGNGYVAMYPCSTIQAIKKELK